MKIGIIGAGNIGATLARKLVTSGNTVKLANSKGPESIAELAHDAGATAVRAEDALKDVECSSSRSPLQPTRSSPTC